MTLKYQKFVSETMGEKSVTALPGIGEVYGERLAKAGFAKARDVHKQYLSLNKDKEAFKSWLSSVSGANSRWAEECWRGIDSASEYNVKAESTVPIIKREDTRLFNQKDHLSFGNGYKLDGFTLDGLSKPLPRSMFNLCNKPLLDEVKHDISQNAIGEVKKTDTLLVVANAEKTTSKPEIQSHDTFSSKITFFDPPSTLTKVEEKTAESATALLNKDEPTPTKSETKKLPQKTQFQCNKLHPTVVKELDPNPPFTFTFKSSSNSNRTFVEYVFSRLEDMGHMGAEEMRKKLIKVLEKLD